MSGDGDATKELFLDALEKAPSEREGFVREACAQTPRRAERIEKLLRAHDRAETRLGELSTWSPRAGERIGPYELIAPLGEGGFGVVWRARQFEPVRRDVALKVLRAASREHVERFELERQTLAAMNHPAVARVFDGGQTHGRPWFAMELVDGDEITRFAEKRRLDLRERLELFIEACRGVEHAHQRGVIHRDLKPSNILVSEEDGRAAVKLIDFGIALVGDELRQQDVRRTRTGQLLGTPVYMSPEQLTAARDIDTRTDVYSLGVVLFELVTGAQPFDRRGLLDGDVSSVARLSPPTPSSRAASLGESSATPARELRGELDWIVVRCLEPERERRYGSVVELVADLERRLRGEAVLAGPPSTWYRARKFAQRNAVSLGAVAAVIAALAIGLVLAMQQSLRARRAEAEQAQAAQRARLEAQQHRAIAQFLEHVLLSVDPAVARGEDTALLRQVLGRASRGLADRVERPPEVEASLRRIVGGAHFSLGDYESSIAELERARTLRIGALGPNARESIESTVELAGALLAAGRLTDAQPLFEEVLAQPAGTLESSDPLLDTALANYSSLLRGVGRPQEAATVLERLERSRIERFGARDERSLLATSNLALCLREIGRKEEGLARLQSVLEAQRVVAGPDHPRTLASIGNLATALAEDGKLDEAQALHVETLELKRKLMGADHPSVTITLNNLAKVHESQGRFDEALARFDEALALRPEGDANGARVRLNRGALLRRMERPEEAASDLLRALEVALETSGESSDFTRSCRCALAETWLDLGRAAEAETLARVVFEQIESSTEAPATERAVARARLGLALAALGRAGEALEHLRVARPALAPDSSWLERVDAALAALAKVDGR